MKDDQPKKSSPDTDRLVEKIRSAFPDVLAIYRFGSSGTADERPQSDVDLAVLAPGPLPVTKVWSLAQDLAVLAGRDVDLIDLHRASTVMRAQVVAKGKRLYCASKNESDAFEVRVYSEYARLNEERRDILKDIQDRGRVYG